MVKRPYEATTGTLEDSMQAGDGRMDRLVSLVDHCTAAKGLAEGLGEKFLVYLLAMAIQEAQDRRISDA